MPPLLLKKQDGATLYATRDLAAVKHRKQEYQFSKMLYEVGSDQKLHFQQFFTAADMLGYAEKEELVHVNHGLISLPEGSMSSRKGRVVHAKALLDEAVTRAENIIQEKNPELEDKQEVAEKVAVAAVKYFDLMHNRVKDIAFNWDTALNFTGSSGPYLQYAYTRAHSIMEKTGGTPRPEAETVSEAEYALVKKLAAFPGTVENTARDYKPNYIATYLSELAELFNAFYEKHQVVGSEKEAFRLALVQAFQTVLGTGLHLLGIEALEEM